MAVVIETSLGDITVDLFIKERPKASLNFLKLCKLKYYNFNLFHTIEPGFIAQCGDPTGAGNGGESIWGVLEGKQKRFFEAECLPKIRHTEPGLLSMVSTGDDMIGSQFIFTLGPDLASLDGVHCVIGEVTEGHEVLRMLNEAICDEKHRPYKDIRITHTVILEDPFENPRGFREPSRSPSPSAERLMNGRIAADEDIDDTQGKNAEEISEMIEEREAKARATILEIVGDIPDADVAPPENVLFVCKLNPVTTDEDLHIIFSRFGKIKNCEVIRDKVSNDSLQYAFIEFEDQKSCEDAYFKMDNVLIDDRRIHVDFSQSVSKIKWRGKGNFTIIEDPKEYKNVKLFRGGSKSVSPPRNRVDRDRNWNANQNNGGANRNDWRRNRRSPQRFRDRRDRNRSWNRGGRNEQSDRFNGGGNRNDWRRNRRSPQRSRSPRRISPRRDRRMESRRSRSPDRRIRDRSVRSSSPVQHNKKSRSASPRRQEMRKRSPVPVERKRNRSKSSEVRKKRKTTSISEHSSAESSGHEKRRKKSKKKDKKSRSNKKKSKKHASSSDDGTNSDSSDGHKKKKKSRK